MFPDMLKHLYKLPVKEFKSSIHKGCFSSVLKLEKQETNMLLSLELMDAFSVPQLKKTQCQPQDVI